MGYVVPGYATRRLKYYDHTVVYYPPFKRVCLPRSLKFDDLPPDIIELVFVYSGNKQLPTCNKLLYRVLKPQRHLVELFFRVNFVVDANALIPTAANTRRVPILLVEVFDRLLFIEHLNDKPSLLDEIVLIEAYCEVKRIQEAREKGETSSTASVEVERDEETGRPVRDFPQAFYVHKHIYFWNQVDRQPPVYNQMLLKLNGHFVIRQVAYLVEQVIRWFFRENNENYDVYHLFHALSLILHLSVLHDLQLDKVEPLVVLIDHLFFESISNLTTLLIATEETLLSRKYRIVEKFVHKFYCGKNDLLSDDYLWLKLREANDNNLTKIILGQGGRPSFNAVL
ncbi:HHL202Cp [Eremothecium sinecaudum]|uniref:HHL202Cp n=1 Tax=Eremothecium sinecaudum TaxID=45286 RepID=A0A0X8HW85_9SACH|nr:HHL202Cp [Eremothecium sinecaudum]AMD22568.1 HHL202Cp [Eremothecium sinecaudum]